MSYGESLQDFYHGAASFVDKIFKGAKPSDLPIEQPTRFKLVINRKTADALGLTIPPQLYIFADKVMERQSSLLHCSRQVLARSCRAGGADQCPKLGVERTQRGHAATADSVH